MYTFFPTNRFNKSFEKIRKHKKYKESEFVLVINTLLSGEKLPKKYREHKLSGEYEGCFECHILNDILLIYYFDNGKCILVGVDIGTHSELFK
jgi:mRNA interferase YafQ